MHIVVFTGGITFASFQPNRILPAKYVFIIGLDSKAFPGVDRKNNLDLRSFSEPWLCDNSVSAKNRYSAKLTTMASYDIGQQVRATLYENGEQISDTQLTSVEIYAKSMLEYYTGLNDNKYDTLINLLRGMIKYTRAAKNYFTNS